MSVLDRFLDVMKLNDEDDFDDDFYDEEDDDDYEERPKRKIFRSSRDDADDEDEYDDTSMRDDRKSRSKGSRNNTKIMPIRQGGSKRQGSGMEVRVLKPTSVEDSRDITETLLSNRTVVLNLEGLDVDIAQRIIDFTSGACFAMAGNLQKVSNYIFIVTPSSVDISGDYQDILGDAFDVSALHMDY